MKLASDPKFLGTALLTFTVLLGAVLLVNWLAGPGAATLAGAVTGAVAVKLFDKLDYKPTEEVQFGAPLVSVPWIYSAVAAILLLYGTRLFADILRLLIAPSPYEGPCSTGTMVAAVIVVDVQFLVGGWLIGRLFPTRALSLASLGVVVVFLEYWFETRTFLDVSSFLRIAGCLPDVGPAGELPLATDVQRFRLWSVVGLAVPGVLGIFAAYFASRGAVSLLRKGPKSAA